MNKRFLFSACFMMLVVFLAITPKIHAVEYALVPFNIPAPNAFVSDINDLGSMVGTYGGDNTSSLLGKSGFVVDAGGNFMEIRFPGANGTTANGITNAGTITGSYLDTSGTGHGYIYQNGNFTTIDAPEAYEAYHTSLGNMNSSGTIIGGAIRLLDPGISFLYEAGNFTTVKYPDAFATAVFDINDSGSFVGTYYEYDTSLNHGFVNIDGKFTTIDIPGSTWTDLVGITNSGTIIGNFFNDEESLWHGFILKDGSFTQIDFPDALDTYLIAINNEGTILGSYYDTLSGPNIMFKGSEVKAVVPEPSLLLLLGSGLAGLTLLRKKKRI